MVAIVFEPIFRRYVFRIEQRNPFSIVKARTAYLNFFAHFNRGKVILKGYGIVMTKK
jgi:uncharacterized protein (DUF39 family)